MRSDKGFTILELVVAIALGSVVLLSASDFLVHFSKYTANVIRTEASLIGTALGPFEEIVHKLSQANGVVIGNETAISTPNCPFVVNKPTSCAANTTCVQVRLDNPGAGTSSNYADDTVWNYWLSGTNLYKSYCTQAGTTDGSIIAHDIATCSFTRPDAKNKIRVQITSAAASGMTSGNRNLREVLDTTVATRTKSAQT